MVIGVVIRILCIRIIEGFFVGFFVDENFVIFKFVV